MAHNKNTIYLNINKTNDNNHNHFDDINNSETESMGT